MLLPTNLSNGYLTALHGHTALFGVYGMLGIGLLLFCVRGLKPDVEWNDKLLRNSFWTLNIGLSMMALLTLLPLGLLQLNAVLNHGYWYARSAEFMGKPKFRFAGELRRWAVLAILTYRK